MRKRYFVDVENIGAEWISFLSDLNENDEMILFISQFIKLKYSDFRKVLDSSKITQIKFHEVFARGKGDNAMDHTLTSVILENAYHDQTCQYIILSSDRGYDDFILELRERKIDICRISINPIYMEKVAYAPKEVKTESDVLREKKSTDMKKNNDDDMAKKIRELLLRKDVLPTGCLDIIIKEYKIENLISYVIKSSGDFDAVLKIYDNKYGKKMSSRLSGLVPKKTRKLILQLFQ